MKKVFYCLICLIGLSACSSEKVVLETLRVYDVANSTCKLNLSPTETRPDFYLENDALVLIYNKGEASNFADGEVYIPFLFTDLIGIIQ